MHKCTYMHTHVCKWWEKECKLLNIYVHVHVRTYMHMHMYELWVQVAFFGDEKKLVYDDVLHCFGMPNVRVSFRGG